SRRIQDIPLSDDNDESTDTLSRKESMMKLLEDDPELLERAKAKKAKFGRLIMEYNLKRFTPDTGIKPEESTIFFYVKTDRKDQQEYKVIVNDQKEYLLSAKALTPIRLPSNTLSKVCVNSKCGLLKS